MSYYYYGMGQFPYDTKPITAEDVQNVLKGWVIGSDQVEEGSINYAHIGHAQIGEVHIREASINHGHIQNLAVGRAHIQDLAVSNAKIADGAIDRAKIQFGEILEAHIADAQIKSAHIDEAQIKSAHIDEAQIKSAHIDEAQIKSAHIDEAQILRTHIGEAEIDRTHIMHGEIITAHIAEGSITSALIGDAQIGTAHIEEGAITTALIGTGAIETAQIADGSITDAKIVELTANKITAGVLDVERLRIVGEGSILYEINVNSVGELTASEHTLDGGAITERSITADRIVADSITAREIASRTITANEIAVNTITADSGILADASITSAHIADASITNAHIDSIDASKITTGVLDAERIYVGKESFFEEGYDPSKIEIGGRNLIRNSANIPNANSYDGTTTSTSQNFEVEEWNTSDAVRILTNEGNRTSTLKAYLQYENDLIGDVVGEEYTASLFVKNLREHPISVRVNGFEGNPSVQLAGYEAKRIVITGIRVTGPLQYQLRTHHQNYSLDVAVWRPKLEKGNKATDWTPAPEDTASDIENAKNHAVDLWRYQDTTYIDGGNIYADTITANTIKGGSFEGKTFTGGTFNGASLIGGTIVQEDSTRRVTMDVEGVELHSKGMNTGIRLLSGEDMGGGSYIPPAISFYGSDGGMGTVQVFDSGVMSLWASTGIEVGNPLSSTPMIIYGNLTSYGNLYTSSRLSGQLTHHSGYFYTHPYSSAYDDGTYIRGFYSGKAYSSYNARTLNLRFAGSDGGWASVDARDFKTRSTEDLKENIVEWEESVLEYYRDRKKFQLYEYDIKNSPVGSKRKHGIVIKKGQCDYPEWLTDEGDNSVSMYEFNAMNARALQESVERDDRQDERLSKLEERLALLEQQMIE